MRPKRKIKNYKMFRKKHKGKCCDLGLVKYILGMTPKAHL